MTKQYLLPGISVLLLAAVLLFLTTRDSFLLDSAEVLDRIEKQDFIIDSSKMNTLLLEGAILVDLSGTEKFSDHPLPGTLNLPLKDWDIKKINEFLPASGKYILCGRDLSDRSMAWVLLTQMGRVQSWVLGTESVVAAGIDSPAFIFQPGPEPPQ